MTSDPAEHSGDSVKTGVYEALALAQNGQAADARTRLRNALVGRRIDLDDMVVFAHILSASGRIKGASTVWRGVLRRDPTNFAALYSLLMVLLSREEMRAAITEITAYLAAGGQFDFTNAAVKDLLATFARWRSGANVEAPSIQWILARIYLLDAQFAKARKYFAAAPERKQAEIEMAAIDVATGAAAPEISRFKSALPTKVLMEILIHRFVDAGRKSDVVELLDTPLHMPNMRKLSAGRSSEARVRLFMTLMPKSGSSYLVDTFTKASGLQFAAVSYNLGAEQRIIPSWIDFAVQRGVIPGGSCAASSYNISQIERHGLPVFVHLRDPRDQVWSLYRWIEEMTEIEQWSMSADYSKLEEKERIYFVYENYFPSAMSWIASWKEYIDQKRNPVVVSRFEDFATNNVGTIKRMLALCDVSVSPEILDEISASNRDARHHFRQGIAGGWRKRVNPPEISKIITENWDDEVMSYFGYTS